MKKRIKIGAWVTVLLIVALSQPSTEGLNDICRSALGVALDLVAGCAHCSNIIDCGSGARARAPGAKSVRWRLSPFIVITRCRKARARDRGG